ASERKERPMEKIERFLRYYRSNIQLKSLMLKDFAEQMPLVNLRKNVASKAKAEYELSLVESEITTLSKMKFLFSGVITAVIVVVSSMGFIKNSEIRLPETVEIGSINNYKTVSDTVIKAESVSEGILLASIMNPTDNHPFQKIGHTNLAPTIHSNTSGDISHTNTDAYADFAPHGNVFPASHSNTVHTNGGHTNQSGI
ncbi:MAG: hypothetical protein LWY06_13975, partial [Firmicutes bacterium]|nr:hypothetical protein [Bacillota bacterium]